MREILQVTEFKCGQCSMPCSAAKVVEDGNTKIEVAHPEPQCSAMHQLNVAAFMRLALEVRAEERARDTDIPPPEEDTTPDEFKEAAQRKGE